jgi:HlyD family secretion protein
LHKLPKTTNLIIALVIIISSTILIYKIFSSRKTDSQAESTTSISKPIITTVTALGRLEPRGQVIKVSARSGVSSNKIEQILVKEGEEVTENQVLAILDNHQLLRAALKQAEEQLRVSQAKLTQLKAGAKIGEIEAQQAVIARIQAEKQNNLLAQTAIVERLTAEVENAQLEYQRHEQLYIQGAISASERDSKKLVLETSQKQVAEAQATLNRIASGSSQQLQEAQATLNRIKEIRQVDIDVLAAQVKEAEAAVSRAQAELDLSYIRAPSTGQIIDIMTQPGEIIGTQGVVKMGETQQMYVIAEVYESDITKVKIGQKATITTSALLQELSGTVETIGLEIKRQEVINSDPAANIDGKIVEVNISLDTESSDLVSGLTNLLVMVKILL